MPKILHQGGDIMYNSYCGIDFGTTNSAVSVINNLNKSHLITFDNNKPTIPSAIFFPEDNTYSPIFGEKAIHQYINGSIGRFMRSIKRILGTDLMELKTEVNEIRLSYEDIILYFIKHLKDTAEQEIGCSLDSVVLGRPVHFQDFAPEADEKAEKMLRKIAFNAGFKNISFQYEPIAAAYAHETSIEKEVLACVIDVGGGTSDFSVIKIGGSLINKTDRSSDILANTGMRIGGNDFDRDLAIKCFMPSFGYKTMLKPDDYTSRVLPVPFQPYTMLSEWSSINYLYTYKEKKSIEEIYNRCSEPQKVINLYETVQKELGHTLLNKIEECKISLSNNQNVETLLPFLSSKPQISSNINDFETSISKNTNKIVESLNECLNQASIKATDIGLIILTGGSTEIPYIKRTILNIFPNTLLSDKNKLSSVASGLAYDAMRLYK